MILKLVVMPLIKTAVTVIKITKCLVIKVTMMKQRDRWLVSQSYLQDLFRFAFLYFTMCKANIVIFFVCNIQNKNKQNKIPHQQTSITGQNLRYFPHST